MFNFQDHCPKYQIGTPYYKTFRHFEIKGRKVTLCGLLAENKITIGVSIQNPNDIYRRKVGNDIAYGRAMKRPQLVIDTITGIPKVTKQTLFEYFDIIERDMQFLVENKIPPQPIMISTQPTQ